MALQPEDRYLTARALAGDLEAWLADEPVSAYREPWTARLATRTSTLPTCAKASMKRSPYSASICRTRCADP